MSGHTPGPWFLDDDETGMIVYPATWIGGYGKGCDNRTRRMALIAAVSPWDGRSQENREAVMAEARANAALIASAPTLSAQVATLTEERDAMRKALEEIRSCKVYPLQADAMRDIARAALEGGRP